MTTATPELNRNFASAVGADGLPVYAPAYIMVGGRLKLHPTAADYAANGYKPITDSMPSQPAPQGYHYEAQGWVDVGDGIERVYDLVQDPPPPPRRWSRLSIKTALAQADILSQALAYLAQVEIATGYSAASALQDCDYIEEGFPTAERWNALLDGAASALGKTRAEIDQFLSQIPTEATL